MSGDVAVDPIRREGYVDLRSYAALGDGRTVALVGLDGSIDWLPIPNLDSTPVFARLLDDAKGGSIELAPVAAFAVTRRYLPQTNVLETTYTTASGIARVTDALVTGLAGQLPWVELARRIDGIEGTVDFCWRITAGTCFATITPRVEMTTHGRIIRAGDLMLAVEGSNHGPDRGGSILAGHFTATVKSHHMLVVAGTKNEPLHLPIPDLTAIGLARTVDNWKHWSDDFNYEGPWADAVQRSALALKLLIHSPSGAIAAAATTSLPENVKGGKNWDYRFAWVRDVTYTVRALVRFGLREETHEAVAWLIQAIRMSDSKLHIFYRLDGSAPGAAKTQDLPGWRGTGPVIVGNDARTQLQLGIFGDLVTAMADYVEAGNVLDAHTRVMLAAVADHVCEVWHQHDSGTWELFDQRDYTASKMGCWQALDSALRLCKLGQIAGDPDRWRVVRGQITEWVAEHCWSEARQSYVTFPGSEQLDASVLLHATSGFDRGPRMSATIDAIRSELGSGALLYRYTGMEAEEGAFVACSFWMASALACVGRHDEAVKLMDELVGLANDVGLYSEMIDPADLSFLGNFPQGLSHLGLINAAITIDELAPR
ncbi:glycoside hydrolase family 15 protein [Cryobacterium sp. CG_9.6]|uniref:glycoside hydrolase family 15 protein n=1 Tax=Cryobacterium sp. CG_9.6 TaxID=2760710 RepID=UPI0024736B3C|nr:glycoside hydrolase family 15 protein [Cryobacterium sp. CG_9.6]MDH6238433.1 GH15 family glucan-1,4-alpha-glucosidase [Cryobacterium sp. CG_9.6]